MEWTYILLWDAGALIIDLLYSYLICSLTVLCYCSFSLCMVVGRRWQGSLLPPAITKQEMKEKEKFQDICYRYWWYCHVAIINTISIIISFVLISQLLSIPAIGNTPMLNIESDHQWTHSLQYLLTWKYVYHFHNSAYLLPENYVIKLENLQCK